MRITTGFGTSFMKGENVMGVPVARWIADDTFENLGLRVQGAMIFPGIVRVTPGQRSIEGIDTWRA